MKRQERINARASEIRGLWSEEIALRFDPVSVAGHRDRLLVRVLERELATTIARVESLEGEVRAAFDRLSELGGRC